MSREYSNPNMGRLSLCKIQKMNGGESGTKSLKSVEFLDDAVVRDRGVDHVLE